MTTLSEITPFLYVCRSGAPAVIDHKSEFREDATLPYRGAVRIDRGWCTGVGWTADGKFTTSGDHMYDLVDLWDSEVPVPASWNIPETLIERFGLTVDRSA